jgi:hypothetical protein
LFDKYVDFTNSIIAEMAEIVQKVRLFQKQAKLVDGEQFATVCVIRHAVSGLEHSPGMSAKSPRVGVMCPLSLLKT